MIIIKDLMYMKDMMLVYFRGHILVKSLK